MSDEAERVIEMPPHESIPGAIEVSVKTMNRLIGVRDEMDQFEWELRLEGSTDLLSSLILLFAATKTLGKHKVAVVRRLRLIKSEAPEHVHELFDLLINQKSLNQTTAEGGGDEADVD